MSFVGEGEEIFFLKHFKTDLQSCGVLLVRINIWAQIPTPVYISAHLNTLWGWGGSFWSGWGLFFFLLFWLFVLFYGHLLLIEVFKSLLFHALTRQVFSSSCTSLFTSQPQLWVSEDLARMPFLGFFFSTFCLSMQGARKLRCFVIWTCLCFSGWYNDGHHNEQSALQL